MKLGKIAKIQSGGTPSRSNDSYYGGNIPWVKISDITDCDGILNDTEEKITELGLQSIRNIIFPKGTLLFAMYGSVGKTAIAGTLLATNQAILGIVPDNKIVLTKYLKYWFDSNKERLLSMANGVALKNLSAGIVKNLDVALPSIEKQEKIVEILDQADELRKKRAKSMEQLEELKLSLFAELIETNSSSTKVVRTEKLHNVVSEIIDCPHSTPNYSERTTSFPCIRTSEIVDGAIDWTKMKFLEKDEYLKRIKRAEIKEGDIIYGREGSFGDAVIVPRNSNMSLGQRVMMIRPKEGKTNTIFLWFLLRSSKVYEQAIRMNTGSTVGHVNVKDIKNFDVVVPPIEIQDSFARKIEPIFSLSTYIHGSLQRLDSLFESCLQRAFNGELIS